MNIIDNIDMEEFINDLYEQDILDKLGIIEEKTVIFNLSLLSRIMKGEYGSYNQAILIFKIYLRQQLLAQLNSKLF